MRSYLKSLGKIIPRLKSFWLLIFILGFYCAIQFKNNNTIYTIGFASIGFACSAYFYCKDQFFFRGIRDAVYLVKNNPISLDVYNIADPETLNALGGKWYEIFHVSDYMARHLEYLTRHICFFKPKERLSLKGKKAKLYRIREEKELINGGKRKKEKTIFAVLEDVRYGIPDQETLHHIWDNEKPQDIEACELDKYIPGNDLVSVYLWPYQNYSGFGIDDFDWKSE